MKSRKQEKEQLPKQYNVSYISDDLPRPTLQQALRHYISAIFVYGAALLFITFSPYFRNLLSVSFYGRAAIEIYWYIYAGYLLLLVPVCFVIRPRSLWISTPIRVTGYLGRVARMVIKPSQRKAEDSLRPSYVETHAIIFVLIKTFYGPLTVFGIIENYNTAIPLIEILAGNTSRVVFFDAIYRLFYAFVFFAEAFVYAIGYHTDSKLFGNKVRYVETNPFHIFVCLACYAPFSLATMQFLGASFHDPYMIWAGDINHPMTWVLRGIGMIFLLGFLSSGLALFTKASNLSNRGIVTGGGFRFVRHPGYSSKIMFWILTFLPTFIPNTTAQIFSWKGYILYCIVTVLGFFGWATLYFLRGITEERFLMRDPEYVEYCKKVKYHFIPFVY